MAWFITNVGFFSVVQKAGTHYLTVRARIKSDLDSLRQRYMPTLSEPIANAGSDYKFRSIISKTAFGEGLMKIAIDIDYDNFKNEVAKKQSRERADVYSEVWADLLALENVEENLI